MSSNSNMYGSRESYSGIVPAKPPNNTRARVAEEVEGRPLTKENTDQSNSRRAQDRTSGTSGLERVREAAKQDGKLRFNNLLHHVSLRRFSATVELLEQSYFSLKKQAAPGVDGTTWEEYGQDLKAKLIDLHDRVHREAYRARPSRRVYISKDDGRQRPLGIAALEDKVLQHAVGTVLNQIWEEDFKGFSYGFRPGRNQHDALDALYVGITRKKVDWVLDLDIRSFFDKISHEWLVRFVEYRIADKRIVRLIQKWLKAGVSEDGDWSETTVGTPQGAVVSPLLANVYLHYVFDLWVEAWRRKVAKGQVVVARYADDLVVGFQHRAEAERFLRDFQGRLAKFGLEIHPEKTRLIEFGRFAASDRRKRGEGKPETFTFLGFTHFCGVNSKGHFVVWRHTAAKRMRAKLQAIKQELRRMMHEPVAQVGAWLKRVVSGYYQYHAVPGNLSVLSRFRERVCGYWRHVLRRRSQRRKPDWDRLRPIFERWIPRPRTLHPYPDKRFDARIQGRSRMR
jgi:RNA-directed DNA polymerase